MSEPLNQRRARAAWRGQREAPGQPKAGRVREIRGPSTALLTLSLCLAGGCQGSAGTPSPPPAQASTTLLAWAVALDHGSPWEVSLVEAAVVAAVAQAKTQISQKILQWAQAQIRATASSGA